MTNQDLYDTAMREKRYYDAADLALSFAAGKASRSGAWNWVESAQKAAQEVGIRLDAGNLSWPDFAGLRAQLRAGR